MQKLPVTLLPFHLTDAVVFEELYSSVDWGCLRCNCTD